MPKRMDAISSDVRKQEKRLTMVFLLCVFAKFMLFNFLWCRQTTFTPFSTVECWGNSVVFSFLIIFPWVSFRRAKITLFLMLILDLLLIINLMYFRTYYTSIPLRSYALAGNLTDFTDSVLASFRIIDLFFPLSNLFAAFIWTKNRQAPFSPGISFRRQLNRSGIYLGCILLLFGLINCRIIRHRSFKNAYDSLQNANMYTCGTPMYTVIGTLYYNYLTDNDSFSSEQMAFIEDWLSRHPAYKREQSVPDEFGRKNCILILAESLESWVLQKEVENREITPYLNRWIQDPRTLYAPNVLSQVKGGRSIDAQLLVNTGLLPVNSGAYSTQFPDHYYPSLVKAFKQRDASTRATVVTVDKHIVWNQHRVAEAFGYDQVIDRQGFIADEKVGPRKKTGDVSFLRQCYEKIMAGEIWDPERNNFLQCVTYSGHAPFVLPDHLRRIDFEGEYPALLKDYMIMANYTDYGIGQFLASLEESGLLEDTIVIITGDHEGLAENRITLTKSMPGKGLVSEDPVVPFIVINSPVSLHYKAMMGQIDIYPTLLDLFGLRDYTWQGLGRSVLSGDHQGYAITPSLQPTGKETDSEEDDILYLQQAWQVSDLLIRYNYLEKWYGEIK